MIYKTLSAILVLISMTVQSEEYVLCYTSTPTLSSAKAKFYASIDSAATSHIQVLQKAQLKGLPEKAEWCWLPREELIQAHPQVDLDKQQTEVHPSNDKMIPSLQHILEVNAKDHAVIVDCRERGQKLSACSLHYYQRSQEKIVASSERIFSVPLEQADSWAQPLLKNFVKGLKSMEERHNEKILHRMSLFQDKDKDPQYSSITIMGMVGRSHSHAIPGIGMSINMGTAHVLYSIGAAGFHTSYINADGAQQTLQNYQGKIGLLFRSDPIKNIVWMLGSDFGWERYHDSIESIDSLFISGSPAIGIPFLEHNQLSLSYNISAHAPLQRTSETSTPFIDQYLSLGYTRTL